MLNSSFIQHPPAVTPANFDFHCHSAVSDGLLPPHRWDGQADPALDQAERWYVAMGLFYPEFDAMAQDVWPEATRFLAEFLAAGRREETRPGPARRQGYVEALCAAEKEMMPVRQI